MRDFNILSALLVAASLVLFAISIIVLPPQVVIQIALDGSPSNYAPKALAAGLPFAGSIASVVVYQKERVHKALFVAAVCVIGAFLTLLFNL